MSTAAGLEPYRRILRVPGALGFSLTGLVARTPLAVASISLVLFVSARTGSYGLAGQIAGSYVAATALVSPWQARLVDRHGQDRMLPILATCYGLFMAAVIPAVQLAAHTPLPHLAAALAGAVMPMIGAYVRARWSHVLGSSDRMHTAFALESVLDEVLFIGGPPLVTLLATRWASWSGVLVAIVSCVLGTLWLARQRSTQPPAHPRTPGAGRSEPLGWTALAPVAATGIGVGALLGTTNIVVVAFATEAGIRQFAGLLLAIWATGSLLSAAFIGARVTTTPAYTRFRIGTLGLTLAALPMPFVSDPWLMAVLLFLAGSAISPTMIARVAIVQQTVPASRLSEGLAWTVSTMIGGVGLGAALAGHVVDAQGPSNGFFVAVGSGAFACLVAWLGRRLGGWRS